MCEVLAHTRAHGVYVCVHALALWIYCNICVCDATTPQKRLMCSRDCTVKRLAGLAAGLNFFSLQGSARQLLIPPSPGSSSCAIILAHPKREKQLCVGRVCSGCAGITVLMPQWDISTHEFETYGETQANLLPRNYAKMCLHVNIYLECFASLLGTKLVFVRGKWIKL